MEYQAVHLTPNFTHNTYNQTVCEREIFPSTIEMVASSSSRLCASTDQDESYEYQKLTCIKGIQ
jgi:hypothetical protein